ncbi:MAG: hypothetical protein J7J65_03660 [Candidatus Korarchaeota archaeon]|nr:hypothetical protein [Candidatus Korarchaeota archaeon]
MMLVLDIGMSLTQLLKLNEDIRSEIRSNLFVKGEFGVTTSLLEKIREFYDEISTVDRFEEIKGILDEEFPGEIKVKGIMRAISEDLAEYMARVAERFL